MFEIVMGIFRLYELMIIARVLFSWVNVDESNQLVQWLIRLTEPVLAPFRRMIPSERMGIDFSPFIVLLLLELLKGVVARVIGI